MIAKIVFKRVIEDGEPNDYLLKKFHLSFLPSAEMMIDDGTGDELEYNKPIYCMNGVPNGFDDSAFLVLLKDIELSEVAEYEAKGWVKYVEPEPEE